MRFVFLLASVFFLHLSTADEMHCQLNKWSSTQGSKELAHWISPVVHDDVYYFSDLNETFVEGKSEYRISARYSLAYGFFYVEIVDKKTELASHSESYQPTATPNLTTRFGTLEATCKFIRSALR